MKKVLFLGLFCFSLFFNFLSTPLYAQETEEAMQVVLPIDVYIGDQAEIRYTFRSAIDFFSGNDSLDHIEIENPFKGEEDKFSVIKSELYRNEMEYTLRIVIVPWVVGAINFPTFNLNDVLGLNISNVKNSEENLSEIALFSVSLFPVNVKSIVEKTGNKEMMPPVPPIVIPGTTYFIFLIILCFVVFLILFFRFLFRFNSIRQKWIKYLKRRAFKKNAEDAIKKIKKLLKTSKLTDIDFCSSLQSITRNYLEFRFDYHFKAISSSGIKSAFEKIFSNDVPSIVSIAVDDITAMFVRTDYIRYAHDSIDSQLYPPAEHQAVLVKSERKTLSDMVLKSIECFEKDEDQLEEENVD